MKDLLFFVLRLLLQLVIFAITGRWPQFAPRTEQRPHPQPVKRGVQRDRPRRAQRAASMPMRSWSYRDEGDTYAPDAGILEGGPARARPAAPLPRSQPPTRSLGRALRDRHVLRDALTLDAALGSRVPRR